MERGGRNNKGEEMKTNLREKKKRENFSKMKNNWEHLSAD